MKLNSKRARRGFAVAAAGVVGLTAAGYALAGSDDAGSPATLATVESLPSEAKYLDTSTIVAQGSVGGWQFVLAPGVGSLAQPNVLCLAVGGPENAGSLLCSFTQEFESKGSFVAQTEGGKRDVWGIAPTGTSGVEVAGISVPMDGRFFKGEAPADARSISFVMESGTKSFPLKG